MKLVVFIFAGMLFGAGAVAFSAQDSKDVVIGVIAARHEAIQKLSVSFVVRQTFVPTADVARTDGTLTPNGGHMTVLKGTRNGWGTFSYLSGNGRFETHWQDFGADGPNVKENFELQIFSKDRQEDLAQQLGSDELLGGIEQRGQLPDSGADSLIDIALGLRAFTANEWLTADEIRKLSIELPDDNHAILRLKTANSLEHVWTFDRKFGYALSAYKRQEAASGQVYLEFNNGDFREVGNVILPFEITTRWLHWAKGAKEPEEIEKSEIRVKEYKLNEETNTPARYLMVWPKGSRVLDDRTGQVFPIENRDMVLDDATINQILKERSQKLQTDRQRAQEKIDSILSAQPATQPATLPASGG